MKKIIIAALLAAMLISCMTACGSKKDTVSYDTTSRVLYTDEDAASDEEANQEETTESDKDKSSDKKDEKSSDSDSSSDKKDDKKKSSSSKSSDSSKKSSSSKSSSSKAASSKSASSKAASSVKTSVSSTQTPSRSTSSAASSASSVTSSEAGSSNTSPASTDTDSDNTDTLYDNSDLSTDTSTDTEIDTDVQTDSSTDTDNGIVFEPFDEEEDIRFPFNENVTIDLYDNIQYVLSTLGDITPTTEPSIIDDEQEDKTYDYGNVIIKTFPYTDGSGDYVASITLTSPEVATAKNVRVGTGLSEALEAYGSDFEQIDDDTFRYNTSDGKYLQINSVNGEIISIKIAIDVDD